MTDQHNEAAHGLQASAVKQRIDSQCCGSCPGGCVVQAAKPVPPAVCEYAVQQLAALKAQPSGVVPSGWRIDREGDRIVVQGPYGGYAAERQGQSGIAESILYCLADAMLSLNSSPVSAGVVDDRAAFEVEIPSIAATFDGLYLTPVMPLKAGDHLMTIAQHLLIEKQIRAALSASAPSHGEQVRDGWKLVPLEATTEMVNALKARISCTSRGGILNAGNALNDAIAAAPSAGSQEQG